ncbi:hypothetical protein F4780DRAFT_489712 [Xylariomycetidae sp. FL0641]|nr:hypothetical protein F4780DRAFT_489712 [Xylariomycetidae sp. FL0641]
MSDHRFVTQGTFGFELEFLALFKKPGAIGPWVFSDHDNNNGLSSRTIPEEPTELGNDGTEHDVHMRRLYHFGAEMAKRITEAGVETQFRRKGHPVDASLAGGEANDTPLGEFRNNCYEFYTTTTIVPEDTMIWTDPDIPRKLVRPDAPAGYFWLGFEVVSKVYPAAERTAAEGDIGIISRALRENYLVSLNAGKDSPAGSSRCAVHVHWGLGGRPYRLLAIRRLLTLLWVAEGELMALHATWRQSAPKYAALLRRGTNMGTAGNARALPRWAPDADLGTGPWSEEMERNVPASVREALHDGRAKARWLWRAESAQELAMLVGDAQRSRKAAVGIVETLPADASFAGKSRASQLHTLEFRHMQGSLDAARVGAWVRVTGRVVQACVELPAEAFKKLLERAERCVRDETSSVYELLGVLGVEPETCDVLKRHSQTLLDEQACTENGVFLA